MLVSRHLQKEGIRPEKIAVTHGHMDHFADAAEMAETYQIPIYFPRKEVGYLCSELARRGPYDPAVFQTFEEGNLPNWGVYVEEGDRIRLDTLEFQVFILPGHSDAGMCLYEKSQGVVFAGDQLFYRSVGRTESVPGRRRRPLEKRAFGRSCLHCRGMPSCCRGMDRQPESITKRRKILI